MGRDICGARLHWNLETRIFKKNIETILKVMPIAARMTRHLQ
jgi:hypothetical protein